MVPSVSTRKATRSSADPPRQPALLQAVERPEQDHEQHRAQNQRDGARALGQGRELEPRVLARHDAG